MGLILGLFAAIGFIHPHFYGWMIPFIIIVWLIIVGVVHRYYNKKYFNGEMHKSMQKMHNAHRYGNAAMWAGKNALEILDEEYAKGNIDDETYKHRKAVLMGTDTDKE